NNTDPNSAFEVPEVNGVIVVRVLPNSPAAIAGIRRGDVITEIDGKAITKAEQLQELVENTKLGQSLKVQLRRNGQVQQLAVKPAELQNAS
ncbi:PDZ domain-containing protein, partial [Pseudanabaenaceae cyanobacterium LEGE 13415]|nr:PDZ domain-containing protein [Pseudanabaenaceae cyanobacterium LEGE 13415]